MRSILITMAAAAASLLWVGTAGAQLMAGWDFSQYAVDGALSTDGATFTDTLAANYSSFDLTNNAGSGSAAFGTLFMNGANGSTNVDEASATAAVVPSAAVPGSDVLSSNRKAPATGPGTNPFNSFSILRGEGQSRTQNLGLTARSGADVVFQSGSTGVGRPGWYMSFAGRAVSGTSTVDVEFSSNCSTYSTLGSFPLTTEDKKSTVVLSATPGLDVTCVRLALDPTAGQPIIDDVAIFVPEPAMGFALFAGVAGLVALARRRTI